MCRRKSGVWRQAAWQSWPHPLDNCLEARPPGFGLLEDVVCGAQLVLTLCSLLLAAGNRGANLSNCLGFSQSHCTFSVNILLVLEIIQLLGSYCNPFAPLSHILTIQKGQMLFWKDELPCTCFRNKTGKVLWTQRLSQAEKVTSYTRERWQCNLDKHLKVWARLSDASVVSGFKDLVHSPRSVLSTRHRWCRTVPECRPPVVVVLSCVLRARLSALRDS